MLATTLCLLSILLRPIDAEQQSLLTNAQVSTLNTHAGLTGDRNSVISAGFKSLIHFQDDPLGDGSQEIQIDLGESMTVASIFVIGLYRYEDE